MKISSFRALCLAAAVMLAPVVGPASVWAQSGNFDEDPADLDLQTLIDMAREAFEEGNFDLAIHRLLMANRKEPNPRLLLNVARSYEQKDDCVRSLTYYSAYIRHPDAEAELVAMAREQLEGKAACSGYSDRLSGRLMLESEPSAAQVFVNGELIGTTPRELAGYPAGNYTIRFEKDGFAPTEREIELKAQTDHTVGIVLEAPAPAADDEVDEIPLIAPAKPGPPLNYVAIGIAGAGLVGLTVGAVYDLSLIPATDEERAQAADDPARFKVLTDQRNSQATMAMVGYIAGGLLFAGGTGWFLYDFFTAETPEEQQNKDDEIQKRLGMQLAPAIGAHGAGLILQGRF